jgi:hypothetical protein
VHEDELTWTVTSSSRTDFEAVRSGWPRILCYKGQLHPGPDYFGLVCIVVYTALSGSFRSFLFKALANPVLFGYYIKSKDWPGTVSLHCDQKMDLAVVWYQNTLLLTMMCGVTWYHVIKCIICDIVLQSNPILNWRHTTDALQQLPSVQKTATWNAYSYHFFKTCTSNYSVDWCMVRRGTIKRSSC